MALQKTNQTISWRFLFILLILNLLLIFVQCAKESEEGSKNKKTLILEHFLPINFPFFVVEPPKEREKRDIEGSGEGEPISSDLSEKTFEEADDLAQSAFPHVTEENDKTNSNLTNIEGSGEVEELSEEERNKVSKVPILPDSEELTTTENISKESSEENSSSEMIFDKSEDFMEKTTTLIEVTTEEHTEQTTINEEPHQSVMPVHVEVAPETTTEEVKEVTTTTVIIDTVLPTNEPTTTFTSEEGTTTEEIVTVAPVKIIPTTPEILVPTTQETAVTTTQEPLVTTTLEITVMTTKEPPVTTTQKTTTIISPSLFETTMIQKILPISTSSPKFIESTPTSTQGLPVEEKPILTTPEPVIEEVFKAVKTSLNSLEASPGNILRKENLTLGADPLLIVTNTRTMDSEENVGLSSSEPKRIGAYIVIALILLSFSSLVGYITFRKRLNRKRQEFESHQESHDTEKALLSLSDYKDNSELEENHLKNNEITPIVVKSNSQINKFEKNTNFSSPKNLNTIANEKNIEKDNVLKSTAENLTQVIIEDSPKEIEEDKNVPSMEKLIVKTRIDQDSIPKKPIIINRSSAGYMPIPQDNS